MKCGTFSTYLGVTFCSRRISKPRDKFPGNWLLEEMLHCFTKVKSSLCATDFGEFYGDVMQALPECTVEQTHDKHMVEQYYSDNCYLMGIHEVHQDQVAMLISKLSKNNSPGLDGITAEHLIYSKSSLLCLLLASLYTIILSRACVPTLFTTGLIVPIY